MPDDSTDFIVTSYSLPDPRTLTTPRERLEYMRDFLLTLPAEKFDMSAWADNKGCDTVCCIGGWTDIQFGRSPILGGDYDDRFAQRDLGLSDDQAAWLFYGTLSPSVTPSQAARVLTHLLDTSTPGTCDGIVDWSIA